MPNIPTLATLAGHPRNPLSAIPASYRQYAYAALFVVALVFTAVQASNGDWRQAVGGIVTALMGALAGSNVDTE